MSESEPEAADERWDLRLLLPAAAGWLTAVVLTAQAPVVGLVVAGAVAALIAILFFRNRGRSWAGAIVTVVGVAVVVVGMALAAALQVQMLRSGPVPDLASAGAAVKVRLKIDGDPAVRAGTGNRRPPYVVVKATVEEVTGRGRTTRVRTPVLVIGSPEWQHVRFGQHVEASGRLGAVEAGSDVAAMLSARAVPKALDEPAWWLRAAERVRAGLRESVAGEPEAVRGLVPALVMGDESALPPDLVEDFKVTGLTHLSAVSGTNLTLLLAFVLPLARLLGVRARGLTVVGLVMVVVFVVLARPQPSVLRAAAMGLVALAAMTGGGGKRRAVRSLSFAVIALLLLDTSLARSAGFALSVLATAGIVLLGPGWRDALAVWMPMRLAEAISCPLAAQIACTPVVAWLSGEVSLVAVGANLLAGPAVGPATILGFGAAGVALLSADLARLAGWLAGWPARWIILIAQEGADLPGAANAWPATVVGVAVLTLLCLVLVVGLHRILARPIAMVLAVLLLALVVLRPVGPIGWPPVDWLMVACDVGQGDGLVVRVGPGAAVVIDTGPEPAAMDRCLRELEIDYVPVLVLSHFHADHAGGIAGVLSGRRVDEIEVTPYSSPAAEYRRVTELAAAHDIPVRTVAFREQRVVGPVTWTTLWPAKVPALPQSAGSTPAVSAPPRRSAATTAPAASPTEEGSPENNASIAMMVEVSGLRMLLTGDLEPESQRAIVASGADLRADVLKVPHHGSGNQEQAFIAATGARLAVISVGIDNDYGHPAPRTLELLSRQGMAVARTDTAGSVAILRTDGTEGTGGRLAMTTEGPSP
ncbi:MAG TPA: ComEC/Rec2 family competence protein [Kribbella sp.]|uniref:ComEC/Rec2 family competence protein n=1 Tax=Kribbella sp. TaxID=1871183 RepID=UPI002D79B1A1|nr:ComEC/Rec2 family competence protein [Kribbella sp.]HET6294130.1 ComEC/Rec2 family competence protein [Kribbella sp.]